MPKPIRKYFACANSCCGFIDFFPSVLKEMDRVYILKGGPGTGKSTLMKKVGEYFLGKGEQIEHIYCSSDTKSLDGVILRDRKTAVVDGTAPHVIEPTAPGAKEEYVNLGLAWDRDKLADSKQDILALNSQISGMYKDIYAILEENKKIHDHWERLYIDNTDFEKLDKTASDLIDEILKDAEQTETSGGSVHRFFGAMTPEGAVNYIEELTDDLKTRYYIKGRPGTGKSTLLKKLASRAQKAGVRTEIYHCGFDTESLDMVVLPELSVCIFDSTAPHELFPSKESDVIFDVYDIAVAPGTDEENAEALSIIEGEYAERMKRAQGILGEIHRLHDRLEEYYIKAVDFGIINQITGELIAKIEK